MARTFIDLSVHLENGGLADPPGYGPEIDYRSHRDTVAEICRFFPGLKPADLPDGEGWAIEHIRLTTHAGTHLDAPWHFASIMDGDKRAIKSTYSMAWAAGAMSSRVSIAVTRSANG